MTNSSLDVQILGVQNIELGSQISHGFILQLVGSKLRQFGIQPNTILICRTLQDFQKLN